MDLQLKNKIIIINRCNDRIEQFEETITNKIIEEGGCPLFIEFKNNECLVIKHSEITIAKTNSIKDCIEAIYNIYKRIDIVISKTNRINTYLNRPIENFISSINFNKNYYHNQFIQHSAAYLKSSNGNMLVVINSNEEFLNKNDVLGDCSISNNGNFSYFDRNDPQESANTFRTNYIYFSKKHTNNHDYLINQCLFLISKSSVLNKNIVYKENRMVFSN